MKTYLMALCVARFALGAADYTLIQDVLGKYPVLEQDGDPRVSGTARVFADDDGVGFELTPGAYASFPVNALKVQTPKEKTFLTREGNLIRQEYRTVDSNTVVEYQIEDGFLTISHHGCNYSAISCESKKISVSKGKGTDNAVVAQEFFSQIAGEYEVELAAGHAPKEENKFASAYLEGNEAVVTFPYCHPGSDICDIGAFFFPLADSMVYRKVMGERHEVFTILYRDGEDLYHFSWEVNGSVITYRNYQYLLPHSEEAITLEFVARRVSLAPDTQH